MMISACLTDFKKFEYSFCSPRIILLLNLEKPGSGKFLSNWIDIQLFAIKNSKTPSHHLRQTTYSAIALYEALVNGDSQYQSLAGQLNGLEFTPRLEGY